MGTNTEITKKKYKAIREAHAVWLKKQYNNVQIYTDQYIYTKLGEQFFLATKTVENILFYRTKH